MIIGYIIYGQDNNSHMFEDAKSVLLCEKCGYVIDFDYIDDKFTVKRKVYDLSYTYDGRCIVSIKFKEFCERHNYKGIKFYGLPNDLEYFYFKTNNILNYDVEKSKIIFENYCNKCGNYESAIIEGEHVFKSINEPLKDGFYSTDIHLGSGNEKFPSVLIGKETYDKLKKEKFKGLIFEKVEI